jgi:hypothetical protein
MHRIRKARRAFLFLLEPLEPRQLLSLASKLPELPGAPDTSPPDVPVTPPVVAVTTRVGVPLLSMLATYSDARPLYSEITEAGHALTPLIDWGDGTTTRGTLARDAHGTIVQYGADHVYIQPGHYVATAFLLEEEISPAYLLAFRYPPGEVRVASRTLDITVLAATPVATGVRAITGVQGYSIAAYIATVARPAAYPPVAVDTAYIRNTTNENDLEFFINWGDDEPSYGKGRSSSDTTYDISAQHVYREPGTYTVTITVREGVPYGPILGRGGVRAKNFITLQTLTTTATIAPFPPGAYPLAGKAGKPVSGLLATFARNGYPDVQTPTAILWDNQHDQNLRVVIHWGDGPVSLGLLNAQPLSAYLQVQGSHTYTRAGTYTVTLSIIEYAHTVSGSSDSPYQFKLVDTLTTTATITGGTRGRGSFAAKLADPRTLG